MKLFHLSDLHLGKRVNEFSMLPDQAYILQQILQLVDAEQPDAVLIAGDIYDKTLPPAEAVQLFDDFLYQLSERHTTVFLISGNHDSPERIAFGGRLMRPSGIYVAPVYDGQTIPVTLKDAYGLVDFFLLPFIKPAHMRRYEPEEEIATYTQALQAAIRRMPIDPSHRSVLMTHQFVTGAATAGSEELSVGGSENVDASVFAPFDYTALGHIHGSQAAGAETIRYCGSPLKYSFAEARQTKSVTVVELAEKGQAAIRLLPLTPLHDLRELRGTYMELTDRRLYAGTAVDDYLHITLTDEEDIPEAVHKLRVIYPNLMKLDYDNTRTRSMSQLQSDEQISSLSPLALFAQFFEVQNGQPLSPEQREIAARLIAQIWEEESPSDPIMEVLQ